MSAKTPPFTNCQIAKTARIMPGTKLGANCIIEDFAIVGYNGNKSQATIIGDNTHIRSHAIIYAGVQIGRDCHISHHAVVRSHCRIGDSCSIGTQCDLQESVVIGDYSRLHSAVFVAPASTVGKYVWIGPHATLTDDKHPPSIKSEPPVLDDEAVVGAAATILPGVHIGRGALIGAGSVVTKSINSSMVAYGNPARQKGEVAAISSKSPWMTRFARGMPWEKMGYDAWKERKAP